MESAASFKDESNMETLEKLINQVKSALNVTQMIKYRVPFYIISAIARFLVAHWWWMNMHDEECIAGADIDPWVKDIPNNVKDEMNQVTETFSKLNSDRLSALPQEQSNLAPKNQSDSVEQVKQDVDIRTKKHHHVYVWKPSQNL